MKPFNLERALAGDPVVTRDGTAVLHIMLVPDIYKLTCPLLYVTPFGSYNIRKEGVFDCMRETSLDLFMASVKQERWVLVYKKYGEYYCSGMYKDKRSCDLFAVAMGEQFAITVSKIEWEE